MSLTSVKAKQAQPKQAFQVITRACGKTKGKSHEDKGGRKISYVPQEWLENRVLCLKTKELISFSLSEGL